MANIFKLIMIFSLVGFLHPAWSNDFESIEHINEITKKFISKNVNVDPDEKIDVQLGQIPSQLARCTKEIEISFPQTVNREKINSVELTCNGISQWHAFIPVDVQTNIKVLIANRTIMPREKIQEEDLEYTYFNKNRLYSGYFKDKSEVIGETVTHVVSPGTILTKKNIQSPTIVLKNQTITIVAQRGAVEISMQGIAKSDGALNAPIKVYNPSSQKTVDAIVVGPSKAQVI